MASTIRLVGRDAEIAELDREYRMASAGEFRAVLLVADPGLGKTRLAGDFMARKRDRAIGLSGRGHPLGVTASFGVWSEALERYLRGLPPAEVRELCGGFTDDLGTLLHTVAALSGPASESTPSRLRLLGGLAAVLFNLTRVRPVIVLLDDAHEADPSSWEALGYFARNLSDARLLALVAVRPFELSENVVATEVLRRLEQDGFLRRLELHRLDANALGDLARMIAGDEMPSHALLDWLEARSCGNPLFAVGLLEALRDAGGNPTIARLPSVPDTLSARVLGLLDNFDRQALSVLECLSTFGRRAEFHDLARLSALPSEGLAGILQRLVRSRLVLEAERGRDLTYEIAHPLGQRTNCNPVIRWNRIATEIFPIDVGPILDARAMAILHAAIHDAVNGVEPRYEPYTANLSFPGASVDAAVARAARDVMLALTPNQQPRIEQEYAAALADVRDGPAKDQGVLLGQLAARANLDRRADDGIVPGPWPPQHGPITEPAYVPTGKPGDYDFTPPFDAPPLGPIALFPGWGRLPPFFVDLAHHRLKGPDRLRSKRYANDVNFVKAYGSLHSSLRTPDQTNTAFFWFEPIAIWNDIATTVMEREQVGPWRAARILVPMNIALVDAEIACFDAKYHFRFWRPYTAIRRATEDDNPETDADPEWLPLLWTPPDQPLLFVIPPIPDYPSAAAMTSAAAAEVLTTLLGEAGPFAVTSVTLPGVARRFRSFSRAAHEAGMSRVFGGIHFVHAVEDGWAAGERVGRDVARRLPRQR